MAASLDFTITHKIQRLSDQPLLPIRGDNAPEDQDFKDIKVEEEAFTSEAKTANERLEEVKPLVDCTQL